MELPYYTTPAHLPQMEITLLHHPANLPQMELPYYTTPAHLPQMEITLLHHPHLFTPDGDYPITPPLLIYPRWTLPYYTTPANLPQMEIYPTTPDRPPAHLPQMEITL